MNEVLVSVVTPTYNRKAKLPTLYKSLLMQTDTRFEWIVIDDGSTDQTELLIENFKKDSNIKITYYKKRNHGKHTALNDSHQFIRGKYVVVVDSDDELIEDAVSSIIETWKKYEGDLQIACITFQKKTSNEEISDKKIKGEYISSLSKEFHNGFRGDHCEVFTKETFVSRVFPEFDNERFIAEGPMWYLITKGKNVVYSEKALYIYEYLSDGLTRNVRRIMAKNPNGAYWNALQLINSDFGLKMQVKNTILALYYGRLAKKEFKTIKNDISNNILFLISFLPFCGVKILWKKYC